MKVKLMSLFNRFYSKDFIHPTFNSMEVWMNGSMDELEFYWTFIL